DSGLIALERLDEPILLVLLGDERELTAELEVAAADRDEIQACRGDAVEDFLDIGRRLVRGESDLEVHRHDLASRAGPAGAGSRSGAPSYSTPVRRARAFVESRCERSRARSASKEGTSERRCQAPA